MKVSFKYGIRTYSGTLDEMTYASCKNGQVCIGRKFVKPALTANNSTHGSNTKNLAEIFGALSSGYKADLKAYAKLNAANVDAHKLPPTSFAIWMKMMYLYAKSDEGHVDLSSVTYNDLQTLATDIGSISAAVDNGFLVRVPGSDELIATM